MKDKLEAFKIIKPVARLCGVTGKELKALIEYLKEIKDHERND